MNTFEIPLTIDLPSADETCLRPDLPPDQRFAGDITPSTTDDWDDDFGSAIQNAVTLAAEARGFKSGRIGVMITDDETIHEINRRHLDHDYPTDVISFTYERSKSVVEGELVVSLCTARRSALELGWDWRHELVLYVVHGTLHICGLEDTSPPERAEMRFQEQLVLERLGIADARRYSPDEGGESELETDDSRRDEAFSTERS